MDKIFLIGHRGVGKTQCLKALESALNYQCLDLDEEVEKRAKIKIEDLFLQGEEERFRNLELKTLKSLCESKDPQVIALGAGFRLDDFDFPETSFILWLRKESDPKGRVFLKNRPALTLEKDPLKEWEQIFEPRQRLYQKHAQAQIFLPESREDIGQELKKYLGDTLKAPSNFYCTLIPKENEAVALKSDFGLELRNDIYSEDQIKGFLGLLSSKRAIILAIRKFNEKTLEFFGGLDRSLWPHLKIDWDLSLGSPQDRRFLREGDIISEHRTDLQELLSFKKNTQTRWIYKYAPLLESLNETLALQKEIYQQFENISFLPRSESLNLSWLREILAKKNPIHFFRFASGSSREQSLWFNITSENFQNFYGILGESVEHSLTPNFHKDFFGPRRARPLQISVSESDFSESLLMQIKGWGVKYLAVTSPFKKRAYDFAQKWAKIEQASFSSINTFYLDKKIQATDTDFDGLKLFFQSHLKKDEPCIVWGGGALLPALKALLPKAYFFSARSGSLREGENEKDLKDLNSHVGTVQGAVQMVWAAGDKGQLPCFDFQLGKLIDLDYKENSQAKKWAYMNQVDYVDAYDFFKFQGKKQQAFWESHDI